MIDPLLLPAFVPAALAGAAGLTLGGMFHVSVAALGLGAVVAAHPAALDAIRWIGVAYLFWLAGRALRRAPGARHVPPVRPARAFREGLLVNLANPKVILFVLALLAQFTDPARPPVPQVLILGAVLSLGGMAVSGTVGVFAGGIGRRLAASPGAGRWLGRASVAIFAALARRLAFPETSA